MSQLDPVRGVEQPVKISSMWMHMKTDGEPLTLSVIDRDGRKCKGGTEIYRMERTFKLSHPAFGGFGGIREMTDQISLADADG